MNQVGAPGMIILPDANEWIGRIFIVKCGVGCTCSITGVSEKSDMKLVSSECITLMAMAGQWHIIDFYRPVTASIGIEPPPPPPPPPPVVIKIDVPIGMSKTYDLKGLRIAQLWKNFGGDLKLWLNLSNTNDAWKDTSDGWKYRFDAFGTGCLSIENASGSESVVYYLGNEINVMPKI
jgi:hypothetical protein